MTLIFESLLEDNFSCSPDARFMLEVIARDSGYWREPANELSVKPFSKKLHVAERVVSAALNELVEAGALERDAPSRVGSGGRASVAYKLSSCHVDALEDGFYPQHAELLQALFSGEDMAFAVLGVGPGKPDKRSEKGTSVELEERKHLPPGGRGRLSTRNRLIFAVLLSRSDQFGEVRISLTEIARCVGMRPEQVKNRLARLMAVGLIRRYVPGLASLIFKAGRVSSTYFLNLEILGAGGAIAVHVDSRREEKRRTHMDLLYGSVSYFAGTGRFRNLKAPRSVLLFLRGERSEVFPLLQHLINGYASHLLSRHWDALGSEALVEDPEVV
ncbi:hypothetical protein ACSEQ0_24420 [Pseudomonas aeruginosa]